MMRVIAIMRPRTVRPMLKVIIFTMVCVIVERITKIIESPTSRKGEKMRYNALQERGSS